MNHSLLIELVAISGFLLMIISSYCSTRIKLIFLDLLGTLLVSIYWGVKGAWVASYMNAIYVLINFFSLKLVKGGIWKYAYFILYPVVIGVALIEYESHLDLLAMAGTFFSVLGKHQVTLTYLRILIVISGMFWLCFGILESSYSQVFFSLLFMSGHCYNLWENSKR